MTPVRSIKEGSASSDYMDPRFKIIKSSLMVINIQTHRITMTIGFEFDDELFSYSGSYNGVTLHLSSPQSMYAHNYQDDNFLVIDSNDDTVHLLDPKGEFLRMSAEDGLMGIEGIAIDILGWLWIGCDDGTILFANYQHFKSTMRRDRYLEKLKDMENV